ncbi:hypothetical protein [Sphingomonas pituitosa]|uniref:hypothetical protein n=1 Tax=Sphingomonas pituitosa TaxID=99597 RepID=UPI0008306C9F|nr:hypothetical protein [Sphingomonas pituitosa]
MTKQRTPGTWAHAAFKIGEHLGAKRAAAVAQVSERTFYNWADPDLEGTPTLAQAFALDMAFFDAGGDTLPFLAVYQAATECRAIVADPCRLALVDDIADTAKEFGEVVEHGLAAARSTASRSDVLRAMTEAAELEQAAKTITRRLGAIFRRGAGPRQIAGGTQ